MQGGKGKERGKMGVVRRSRADRGVRPYKGAEPILYPIGIL